MIKESVTIMDACSLLNELLLLDRDCIETLTFKRISCNDAIANHPTIQVDQSDDGLPATVGILGILNGIFGAENGWGAICAEIDDYKIIRFQPTPIPQRRASE